MQRQSSCQLAQQRLHLERYVRVQRNDACIDLRRCESERLLWKNFVDYQQRTHCYMRNVLRPVFEYIRRHYLFTNKTRCRSR